MQFSDLFNDVDCSNTFHVFISHRFGGADDVRITAVGRFTSEAKRLEAQDRLVANENRCSFCQWSFDTVGSSAKEAFHAYVETRKQKRPKSTQPAKGSKNRGCTGEMAKKYFFFQ